MGDVQKIIVQKEHAGFRFDKFLVMALPSQSRASIQKKIEAGEALLNGRKAKAHTKVKWNDGVALFPPRTESMVSQSSLPPLRIIFEHHDFLIIDKPAGIATHPAPGYHGPTLTEMLVRHDSNISNIGDEFHRPGIVHRLDRDVSGVMVACKTQAMFEWMKKQFHDRRVLKTYIGLVFGKCAKQSGVIHFPIQRSKTKGGRMAAKPDGKPNEKARSAVTEYEVMREYRAMTLMKIFPKTGRTHQIRVHFFAIGHPLVGDQLYRSKKFHLASDPGRLLLHSHQISFTMPMGEQKTWTSQLPPDFESFLHSLH